MIWTWVVASGAAFMTGSWFAAGDAVVVVIAAIAWLLASGWVITRLTPR